MRTFEIDFGKRGRLKCNVQTNWEEILSLVLRCGTKQKREVTRRSGVRREHRENLETNLKGSLGLKGLATFESAIHASTSEAITFEEIREVKDTFVFEAPKRGRRTVLTYQQKQVFHFEFEDDRWYHKNRWTLRVEKWLERYHDDSKVIDYDPQCGGKQVTTGDIDGNLVFVPTKGNLSMSLDYQAKGNEVSFPALKALVSDSVDNLPHATGQIPGELLSPHLIFLSDQKTEHITGKFLESKEVVLGLPGHEAETLPLERGYTYEMIRERCLPQDERIVSVAGTPTVFVDLSQEKDLFENEIGGTQGIQFNMTKVGW